MENQIAIVLFCSCGGLVASRGSKSSVNDDIAAFLEQHAEQDNHEMYTYHGINKISVTAQHTSKGWHVKTT